MDARSHAVGIGLLPQGPVTRQLREGALVPVLEDVVGLETPLNLVFVDREFMPPRMRLFIDRAIEYLGGMAPGG